MSLLECLLKMTFLAISKLWFSQGASSCACYTSISVCYNNPNMYNLLRCWREISNFQQTKRPQGRHHIWSSERDDHIKGPLSIKRSKKTPGLVGCWRTSWLVDHRDPSITLTCCQQKNPWMSDQLEQRMHLQLSNVETGGKPQVFW